MKTARRTMTRPDGRTYRPRKPGLRARGWDSGHESGVIVFGTLDAAEAQKFADECCTYWFGAGHAGRPEPGWFRDTFRYGDRQFAVDEKRGSAGVYYTYEQH